MSIVERRRCDVCGQSIESDALYSLPPAEGWGRLNIYGDASADFCPECLVRIVDYLHNRRSTFQGVKLAEMEDE
jgi:hypothetical protein